MWKYKRGRGSRCGSIRGGGNLDVGSRRGEKGSRCGNIRGGEDLNVEVGSICWSRAKK